ncbi:hypothetical protein PR048_027341 [Dryococelus australis]|uniref:Uncharacterized protein n=1 Tax=Dryococelus australis TaxID=614101 RepID=A0ABQ9GFM2_9NEOP|nr:hypothetical protein PR048_027341 [Dryococelus australis]
MRCWRDVAMQRLRYGFACSGVDATRSRHPPAALGFPALHCAETRRAAARVAPRSPTRDASAALAAAASNPAPTCRDQWRAIYTAGIRRVRKCSRGCFKNKGTAGFLFPTEACKNNPQNDGTGETGDPRENLPTNGIVRHERFANRIDSLQCGVTKFFAVVGVVAGKVSGYRAFSKTKSVYTRVHWAAKVVNGDTAILKFIVKEWQRADAEPCRCCRVLSGPGEYENAFSSRQQPFVIDKLLLGAHSIEVEAAVAQWPRALASRHGDPGSIPDGHPVLVIGLNVSSTARSLETVQVAQGRGIGGRIGKESAMAFVRDPSQHSPGGVSENNGKPKSGWRWAASEPVCYHTLIGKRGAAMKARGETGDPQVNPPTNGIVRHDSHLRKSGDSAGNEPGSHCGRRAV